MSNYELTEDGERTLDRFDQVFVIVEHIRERSLTKTKLTTKERFDLAELVLYDLYNMELNRSLRSISAAIKGGRI